MNNRKTSLLYGGPKAPLSERSVLFYRGVVHSFLPHGTMATSKCVVQGLRLVLTTMERTQTPPPSIFSRAPKGGLGPRYSIEKFRVVA